MSPYRDPEDSKTDTARGWRQAAPRLVLGLGLVALGVLFTLDNLGTLEAREYLHLWPLALVALGLAQLLTGETVGGAIFAVVGGWLLAFNTGYLAYSPWDLWPLLLVGVGAGLMFRALRPRAVVGDPGAVGHAFALLSGVSRKSASHHVRGGSYTAIMGGCEVDLRGAKLAEGRAVIDLFAFWGGIEIKVPPTWAVTNQVWPFLGGVEDTTSAPAPEDVEGELVLTGWAVMGGIEVGN